MVFIVLIKSRPNNGYPVIKCQCFLKSKSSSKVNSICIYFSSQLSELLSLLLCKRLVTDLLRSLIVEQFFIHFQCVSALISRTQQQIFTPITFLNVPIYFIDKKIKKLHTIWRHVFNVVNKNTLFDFWSILILFRSRFFISIMSSRKKYMRFLKKFYLQYLLFESIR